MTDTDLNYDVIIIGGGPAGCSCALYTSRSSLKTCILDKNPSVGALAVTQKIANYPGVNSETSGASLLQVMREQAIGYGTKYVQTQVYGIDLNAEIKKIYTPEGVFTTRALVLATGAMGRSSTLPGESEFLGRGVSYCATCDGAFYKKQDVAVYGINQEAVDEALVLTKFASKVHWITNAKPSSSLEGVNVLKNSVNLQHWQTTSLISIQGDDQGGVTNVELKTRGSDQTFHLDISGVFIYSSGSLPIIDYLNNQVKLNNEGGILVDESMMTENAGVWAIGDVRNTPFKQAVVACSDGCIAAMAIDKFLNQRKQFRVDWIHK